MEELKPNPGFERQELLIVSAVSFILILKLKRYDS